MSTIDEKMIQKGIDILTKKGALATFKIIGCTDFKAVYLCDICSYKFDDENCKKENCKKLYVKED